MDLNPGQGLCDAYKNPSGTYKCSFLKVFTVSPVTWQVEGYWTSVLILASD